MHRYDDRKRGSDGSENDTEGGYGVIDDEDGGEYKALGDDDSDERDALELALCDDPPRRKRACRGRFCLVLVRTISERRKRNYTKIEL
jgi:hypothetical protein